MSSPKTKVTKDIMIDTIIEYDLEHRSIEEVKQIASELLEQEYHDLSLEEIEDFYREIIEDIDG